MSEQSDIFSLPKSSIVLYFAIREFQTADVATLGNRLGWSRSTTYRALSVLCDAGLLVKREREVMPGKYEIQSTRS